MLYSLLVPLLFLVGFAVRKPRSSTFRIGGKLKRTASTTMNPVIGTYVTPPTAVGSSSLNTPGGQWEDMEILPGLPLVSRLIVLTESGNAMEVHGESGLTQADYAAS